MAFQAVFSLFIPSILAAYDDIQGDEVFAVSIALAYPAMSSVELILLFLVSFILVKLKYFGYYFCLGIFIVYLTHSFFCRIRWLYYDGHPVDILYVYSYVLLIFALVVSWKSANKSTNKNPEIFFSEHVKFETITKFGIPLTLAIIAMVIFIIMIQAIFIQSDEQISLLNITIGIVGMLSVLVLYCNSK